MTDVPIVTHNVACCISEEAVQEMRDRAEQAEAENAEANAWIAAKCTIAGCWKSQCERAEAALIECIEERDLAIVHDRQPYPTADAYERVCDALERAEARLALANIDAVNETARANDAGARLAKAVKMLWRVEAHDYWRDEIRALLTELEAEP